MRSILMAFTFVLAWLPMSGKNALDYDDPPILFYGTTIVAEVAKIGHAVSRYGKFEGSNIATPWLKLDPKAATKLGQLLEKRLEEEGRLYARHDDAPISIPLCFDPGYAIRLKTDKGSRNFVICLHCDYVYVYDDSGHELGLNLEGDFFAALVASYNEEFGNELNSAKHPNQSTDPTP